MAAPETLNLDCASTAGQTTELPPTMPISDLDIHRAANVILKQHGDGAMAHARSRIAELSVAGDAEGVAAWSRIVVAIEALRKPAPDQLS